ncbi:MAG: serine protease [Deltaproteobacteria bacterium]|nr:serine protease [Deltaproteobacteria bacterium]
MDKGITLPVILQFVGVLIIIAEVILPSGGLLSLLAAGVIGYSLYFVFDSVSIEAGMMFVLADVIILPISVIIGLKLLAKSPATLNTELSSGDGIISQVPELEEFMGQKGKSLSILRPSGAARINGKRLDVVSRGEYIDKDKEIIVISVTGNQIIVKEA